MHHMIVFGLLHATLLLVVAFFVAFAAGRAGGLLKLLGAILAIWLVVLAIGSIVFGIMHPNGRHVHGWMEGAPPANAEANAPAPAANTAP